MFLRTNSIWVKKYRNTIVSKLLFNTLQEGEPIKWTKPKIKEHIATRKNLI